MKKPFPIITTLLLTDLVVLVGAAFAADYFGYERSVRKHGDWIIARQGADCLILDPHDQNVVGRWERHGDRCYLSGYLKDYSPPWK